ncbi:MAG TPA: hypothetical protein VIY48_20945 [Candidatus Paceibacterota bacterium]
MQTFDPATGLWHVSPAPSSWNDQDQPSALALIIPKRDVLLANINWAFQFEHMDLFLPNNVYGGTMTPIQFLFAQIFTTDLWSKAVTAPWDLR